ncbi:(2Fe-2S) ferredoxin domain-containing protein [Parafrankia sp. FMc2]|uniref:(2Fe-2S) ferredoxin domain-containing protein n=1 Tax=Parafrankia sp. FMc2 TaxID=3233196 RepID=UPI0034D54F29
MVDQSVRRVLVGMGADAPGCEGDLLVLAAELEARIAYLQLARPTVHEVLNQLAAEGSAAPVRLIAAPISGAPAPARSWLRRIAGDWMRQHPGSLVIDVAKDHVTGREAVLSSAGWDEVPTYGRHVLLCRGPRCTARGAADTAQALATRLKDRGLTRNEVLVTQTGCLHPCNHAPVVAVTPDDEWWGPVTASGACALVDRWAEEPRSGPPRPIRRPPTEP